MEDGSVEIVALADSDLAAITPKAPRGSAGAPLAAPMNAMAGQQPALAAPRANPMMQANPYASGMPDVFSSVFGASPEAGAENMTPNVVSTVDAASGAAAKSAAVPAAPKATLPNAPKAALAAPAAASLPQRGQRRATERPRCGDASHRRHPRRSAQSRRRATAPAARAPRTMAESNPWLIDHARRIAAEQQQEGAYSARPAAMTPAAAMAKGLGAAVEAGQQASKPAAPASRPIRPSGPVKARNSPRAAPRRKCAASLPAGDDARTPASVAEAIKTRMEQVVNDTVMSELSSMRGMMEEHFAGLLWGDRQRRSPARAALTKHLFAAGFSAQLVQMMVDNLPDDVDNMEGGMEWVRSVLESNLPVMEDEDALMERGGVFALMGPTGVGKTTTTAKLAARCVMRFGASKVALLTTDSYRIGGHEQLRIFGKILGVSVHAVKDGGDLQLALSELRNKHIVLIDTIGMSQRDRLVSDQIAMLCRAGQPVQRLLLLNATSHGDTLNEVVQAYQRAPDQQPLAGCILTKLDEATNLGGVLDTVIRYKLPVHYVSTGQKVPENLYVATKKFLIKSTFCIPRDNSPFVPHDDDIPALLSALSARSTAELHEVRFG